MEYVAPELEVLDLGIENSIMNVSAVYGESGQAGANPEIVMYGSF